MIKIEMQDDVVAMLMMANGIEPDPKTISNIVEELVVMHCRARYEAGLGHSNRLGNMLKQYDSERSEDKE